MTPPPKTIEPIRAWATTLRDGTLHPEAYMYENEAAKKAAIYGGEVIKVMITPISPQPEGEKGFEGMVMTNLDDMIKELSCKGEDCFFPIDSTINLLNTAKHRIENLESDLAHYKQKAEEMEKHCDILETELIHALCSDDNWSKARQELKDLRSKYFELTNLVPHDDMDCHSDIIINLTALRSRLERAEEALKCCDEFLQWMWRGWDYPIGTWDYTRRIIQQAISSPQVNEGEEKSAETFKKTMDARDWAREWCRIARTVAQYNIIDEGWMTTWFANAIMFGFDEAQSRAAIAAQEKEGNEQ